MDIKRTEPGAGARSRVICPNTYESLLCLRLIAATRTASREPQPTAGLSHRGNTTSAGVGVVQSRFTGGRPRTRRDQAGLDLQALPTH